MGASSDVTTGSNATAAQYNNLRADVVNTSTGHDHDGTDSKPVVSTQTDATASRALATVYQNTTGKPMWVTVSINMNGSTSAVAVWGAYSDGSNPPTTQVVKGQRSHTNPSPSLILPATFVVLPGNYYKVQNDGTPTVSIFAWIESY